MNETRIVNLSYDTLEDDGQKPSQNNRITLEREFSNPLDSVCPICMLTFRVDDFVAWTLSLTTCSHVYHTSCLRERFKSSHNYECLYCKGDFRCRMDCPKEFTYLQRDFHDQAGTMNKKNNDYDESDETAHNENDDGKGLAQILGHRKEGCFRIRYGHGLRLPSN